MKGLYVLGYAPGNVIGDSDERHFFASGILTWLEEF